MRRAARRERRRALLAGPARALFLLAGALFLLAGPAAAAVTAGSQPTAPAVAGVPAQADAGFGSTLHAFEAVYPPNREDCPVGACYGPLQESARPSPEFSFLTLAKGKVVGWDQALRPGTPLLQAELQVAELLPADVVMGSQLVVIHHDQFGHSCAIYDLYSRTLARRYGRKGPAGNGSDVGVELATVTSSGGTTYNPRALDLAIVVPGYLDHTANC